MDADDWNPPNCRHGNRPIIERQWIDLGLPSNERILGRKELYYDCPTPAECVATAYGDLERWIAA